MTTATTRSSPRLTRERRKSMYMLLTLVSLAAYLAVIAVDVMLAANLLWLTILLVFASAGFAFAWARNLDEAAMQAHYVAWYWGGSLGLMVSVLIYLALGPILMTPGDVEDVFGGWLAGSTPNFGFHVGFMLAVTPAVLGYLIWWALLWLRRN